MNSLNRRVVAVAAAVFVVTPALAAPQAAGDRVKDAWIDGSVETALLFSTHLNNFKIDTDVQDGVVTLSGSVDSDIDRDLAGEIAKGVDGVVSVDNDLKIDSNVSAVDRMKAEASADARDFRQWFDDTSTTAAVKSKLLANANTQGLKINVSTNNDVVTLDGQVGSGEESALAENIAKNIGGVDAVDNRLMVAAR